MIFIVKDTDLEISIPCPTRQNAEKLFDKITDSGRNAELFVVTADGEIGELERVHHPKPAPRIIQTV